MGRRLIYSIVFVIALGAMAVQAQDMEWIRAAYWDGRYPTAWAGGGEATRDALQAAGYEILDADQLKTWMTARISDKKFSVVVFCRDVVPDTVVETQSATCTLRKYLDAGGKIVWYADIPFYYWGHADGNMDTWGDGGAPAVLGFNTSSAPRDSGQTATFTPAGITWGLTDTWTSQRPLAPSVTTNVTILATDNNRNAPAWAKHYVAKDKFRGFVRFRDTGGQPIVEDIMRLAEYVSFKASNPSPADGAPGVSLPLFTWDAGSFAIWHDLYLGTSPELTEADKIGSRLTWTTHWHVPGLAPGTTYYWRVDEIAADETVVTGDVWTFTATPQTAYAPSPRDGDGYADPTAVLQWSAGLNAVGHDVYFGTDRGAVEAGAAETLKATNQVLTSYTPAGLQRGVTYYWRVDEVATGGTVTGPVWSFTVRPVIAKTDPSLVGWWTLDDESSNAAVDHSGWDNYGTVYGSPAWTEGYFGDALTFDGIDDYVDCGDDASLNSVDSVTVAAWTKLGRTGGDRKIGSNQNNATGGYKLGVFTNDKVEFEVRTAANQAVLNRAVEGGTVLEADVWYHVAGVYNKGQHIRTYVNGKLDRELGTSEVAGISTGTFKLGRESYSSAYWWLGALDDVRVYNRVLSKEEIAQIMVRSDPLLAYDPQPQRGAKVDIRDATDLSWSPGDTATEHDVYFGTDRDAVKTADAGSPEYRGQQTGTSYSLDGLVEIGGGSYFWRIDEVETDAATVHRGTIWGFTVPNYLIVDEFESYTDDFEAGEAIWQTWIDGLTNGTGSIVGYFEAPFAERTIVHSGKQSMPFEYNNAVPPYYSEAEREWTPPQNWTIGDVTDLSLWIQGHVATFAEITSTRISMSGGGTDIWGQSDEFRFAYKTLTGDGTMIARVASRGPGSNNWAKGGVMIRDGLEGGSTHAMMVVTGGDGGGANFQWRATATGTSANGPNASPAVQPPVWVKIERKGNNLSGYLSADGAAWTQLGTTQTIAMTPPVYIGLAVTSHQPGELRGFEFDNVSTTGNVTGAWKVEDVGVAQGSGNDLDELYIVVQDNSNKSATVKHPDPGAVLSMDWAEWKIPLTEFAVNLSRIKKLFIGVGDRDNPIPDGSGLIFVDDIRVTKPAAE